MATGDGDQATNDAGGQLRELALGRSGQTDEAQRRVGAGARDEQAVGNEAVEMGINGECAREALDEGHRAGLCVADAALAPAWA